jgi:uncharacterized protein (UPF0147 family)
MTLMFRRYASAVVAATALTATMAGAPAQANGTHRVACSITAAERAAAQDARHADVVKLGGHHATAVEKEALKKAITALVKAAKDAKMPEAARTAAKAQIKALTAQLRAGTTTQEQRTAIRAQITALRLQLDNARLTSAERRAVATQAALLRAALRDKPTKAEQAVIRADIKVQTAKLSCRTA